MVDISNSAWNETDASCTSASPNGYAAGTFFNQVEPIGRQMMGAISRFWHRMNATYTSTGSSGTYILTPSNTTYPTAYVQGETYTFKAHQASAGSDTFQISNTASLSAINIYKSTSSGIVQIAAGDIQTGAHIVGQIDTALNGGAGGFITTGGLIPPSSGTVNGGTSGQVAYYGSTGTAVSGESLSTLIDSAIANTQGDILYRGSSAWSALAPGSNGQFLQTQGASANPQWATFVPSLSNYTGTLSNDVTMSSSSTWYDGPSIAQGTTGTWLVTGTISIAVSSSQATFYIKLHDGTNVYASAITAVNSQSGANNNTVCLSAIVSSPAGNLRIAANNISNTQGVIKANGSGLSHDSQIQAIRIA